MALSLRDAGYWLRQLRHRLLFETVRQRLVLAETWRQRLLAETCRREKRIEWTYLATSIHTSWLRWSTHIGYAARLLSSSPQLSPQQSSARTIRRPAHTDPHTRARSASRLPLAGHPTRRPVTHRPGRDGPWARPDSPHQGCRQWRTQNDHPVPYATQHMSYIGYWLQCEMHVHTHVFPLGIITRSYSRFDLC